LVLGKRHHIPLACRRRAQKRAEQRSQKGRDPRISTQTKPKSLDLGLDKKEEGQIKTQKTGGGEISR